MPRQPRIVTIRVELDATGLVAALRDLRSGLDRIALERERLGNLAAEFETYAGRVEAIVTTPGSEVAELGRRAALLGARPPVEVDDPSLPCSAEVDWVPVGEVAGQHKPRTVFAATLKADAPIGSGQAGDVVPAIYHRLHDTCRAVLADQLDDDRLDPRPVVEPSDGEAIDSDPPVEVESPQGGAHPVDDADEPLHPRDETGRPMCGATLTVHGQGAICWLNVVHEGRHVRRARAPQPGWCSVPVPGDLSEPCYLDPGHAGEHAAVPF